MDYVITTDTTCDMPQSFLSENSIGVLTMSYTVDDVTYTGKGDDLLLPEDFYQKLRSGSMPQTAQVNPDQAESLFESYLKQGISVLHIAFYSALSGSYQSTVIAAENLNGKYGAARVVVIDSKCASMGEGLILYYAVKMKQEGKNMDEIISWILENRCHVCHVFTVDDLNHLHRGGRVSKATAVLGTLVNIKPMLHVDGEGKLTALGKVRGRKKSLSRLISMMEERIGAYRESNDVIYICHGDCEEDAEYVASLVRKKFGYENILINPIGPTIGAHAGPGTVGVFFLGDHR